MVAMRFSTDAIFGKGMRRVLCSPKEQSLQVCTVLFGCPVLVEEPLLFGAWPTGMACGWDLWLLYATPKDAGHSRTRAEGEGLAVGGVDLMHDNGLMRVFCFLLGRVAPCFSQCTSSISSHELPNRSDSPIALLALMAYDYDCTSCGFWLPCKKPDTL
ncbi:hypothetical protein L7F22_037358 [Adiantum nelumboides]|nr:hypothetical protein [Adiantum nelumboides]